MASRRRSEPAGEYAPADHIDTAPESRGPENPRLGPVGWLRFIWRQLTSMRTAIVLLLLLAVGAVPGSLVPQMSSDPNGVIAYHRDNPELSRWLDAFGLFSTFETPWFSAIYLLLFVSLIGCVLPRAWHHAKAMLAKPPRTPARLSRLEGHLLRSFDGSAEEALAAATRVLRRRGYRVAPYADGAGVSVSAERGYLRETGNLLFHVALIGVLISVAVGGAFGYTGQRVVAEGYAFTNVLSGYDSFHPGRLFDAGTLPPFSIKVDDFEATYEAEQPDALGAPLDYDASVTVTKQDGESYPAHIKVNEPLDVDGVQVYLLGNGYAPVLTVRDPAGDVVFSQPTLFRPMNGQLLSLGVIKIPDGLPQQIGIEALLYPTAVQQASGAFASLLPELHDPLVTLEVYTGDLGLDSGAATNVYTLNTAGLTKVAGRDAPNLTIALRPGQQAELPDGLGTIELSAIPQFVALQMHHDPAQGWVFGSVLVAVLGLLVSLFVPRRRVWARVLVGSDGSGADGSGVDGGVTLEWAGLARGEDARLAEAVAALAEAADPTA